MSVNYAGEGRWDRASCALPVVHLVPADRDYQTMLLGRVSQIFLTIPATTTVANEPRDFIITVTVRRAESDLKHFRIMIAAHYRGSPRGMPFEISHASGLDLLELQISLV